MEKAPSFENTPDPEARFFERTDTHTYILALPSDEVIEITEGSFDTDDETEPRLRFAGISSDNQHVEVFLTEIGGTPTVDEVLLDGEQVFLHPAIQ